MSLIELRTWLIQQSCTIDYQPVTNMANFCPECGKEVTQTTKFCPECGEQLHLNDTNIQQSTKRRRSSKKEKPMSHPKSGITALGLCFFFGFFGVHRFYVEKKWTGLLMLFTGGIIGVWVIFDLVLLIQNKFEDKQQRPLTVFAGTTPLKNTLSMFAVIFSWLAMILVSLMALMLYATSGLVSVVTAQLNAFNKEDISTAYSYMSRGFQSKVSLQLFGETINQIPILKSNPSTSFYDRSISGNYGSLGGTLTGPDKSQLPIQYQLIKEQGVWKINGFR